ncbi:MAG TPA: pyridoxamine 5'-phosphate oxidase family protein [Acidimicrobiales bacterium]|nr:pyridoxamine 5'-phosphate oxidase family protein [Acidimicrobiales bacterium]
MELASFIESHRRAFLVTCTAQGTPTAHPMTLIPHDGVIYFNTYRKSAKVRNLERDPRVACLATSPDGGAWAAVQGRAEVVPASELPAGLLGGGQSDVMSDEDLARVRERLASGKRVYLRVAATSVTGADGPGALPAPVDGGPRAWESGLVTSAIAMTAAEVEAFLRDHSIAAFASLDGTGSPQVQLARYRGGPGDLVVGADADGPVCLTVDEFPTYNEIRGVMVHGSAHALGGRAGVVPERVLSFDFRKIGRGGG